MRHKQQVHRQSVADYHAGLFGETFLRRSEKPIFACGKYKLTLHELAHDLDYPFPLSARLLQRVLETNEIRSLNQLFEIRLHGLAALHGVGESVCAVATIILDHNGYNLHAFCQWSDSESHVRFTTMKAQQRDQQTHRKNKYKADKKHLPSDFADPAAAQLM